MQSCINYYSTIIYKLKGDTLINSKIYHKILKPDNTYSCGIREDTLKHVYKILAADSIEYKIFDFSAGIGDTINFVPVNIVKSIDSVLINNQYRKRFITGIDTIIEGLGNLHKIVFDNYFYPENEPDFSLLCYKQNDILIYMNPVYNTCDTNFSDTTYFPWSGINDIFNDIHMSQLYPNPANNYFAIRNINKLNIDKITISNLLGQEVMLIPFVGSNELQIDVSSLDKGMYFINLFGVDSKITTKFIKE